MEDKERPAEHCIASRAWMGNCTNLTSITCGLQASACMHMCQFFLLAVHFLWNQMNKKKKNLKLKVE